MDDYSHATEMPVSHMSVIPAQTLLPLSPSSPPLLCTVVAVSEADIVGPSAKPEGYL